MENKSQFIKDYKQYKENLKALGGPTDWTQEKVDKLNKIEVFEAIKGFNELILFLDSVLYAYEEGSRDWENECNALRARCERMERALNTIQKWQLPATGQFWDDEKTQPMSYGAAYGSNGERDFMRNVANQALQHEDKPDYPKLTPEQIQERKEAIEWIRNPAGGMRWITGEYDRLYEQLKAQPERKISCFVDYNFPGDTTPPCRDICAIRGNQMEFRARGICYGNAYRLLVGENEKGVFLSECERLHVEWLDEEKEVENA